LALTAAFVWGGLSILLSPCHLSSIPLIVGFVDAQGRTSPRRAFAISTLFAVGILVTIGLIAHSPPAQGACWATSAHMQLPGCGNLFYRRAPIYWT